MTNDTGLVERPPSNAEMIASLQATAIMFRMFSLDELRRMQAADRLNPPSQEGTG